MEESRWLRAWIEGELIVIESDDVVVLLRFREDLPEPRVVDRGDIEPPTVAGIRVVVWPEADGVEPLLLDVVVLALAVQFISWRRVEHDR